MRDCNERQWPGHQWLSGSDAAFSSIAVPASSLNDPAGTPLSGATTTLMRLGTPDRDARAIAETLAELGASININNGERYAYARFSTLMKN